MRDLEGTALALGECQPQVRLDGQAALVTGAGRGIGRAIALALGQAGAAVAVCARSEDEITGVASEIAAGKGRALAVRCDVLHRREVEDMAARGGGGAWPGRSPGEQRGSIRLDRANCGYRP